MDSLESGLWGSIISYCPSPEKHEIKLVIGSKLVEDNMKLWEEVKTLSQIVAQVIDSDLRDIVSASSNRNNMNSFNSSSNSSSSSRREPQQQPMLEKTDSSSSSVNDIYIPTLTLNSVSLLRSSNEFNNRVSSQKGVPQSSRSSRSDGSGNDNFDLITHIRDDLCLDRISKVVEDIRNALREEKLELEQEVKSLTEMLDSESDKLCATPRDRPQSKHKGVSTSVRDGGGCSDDSCQLCVHCGRRRQQQPPLPLLSVSQSSKGLSDPVDSTVSSAFSSKISSKYICSLCKDKDRKLRKSKAITPGELPTLAGNNNSNNSPKPYRAIGNDFDDRIDSKNRDIDDGPSNAAANNSKKVGFRDRLQNARDEKFFMDD